MTNVFFDNSTTDRLNAISGLNNDIYEIPTIRSFSSRYVAFGFEDHGPCTDNPSGVCATNKEEVEVTRDILDKLSPSSKCAYEIYWANNILRTSTDGGSAGGEIINGIGSIEAIGGKDNLETELAKLDRSKTHVVRMFFAHHNLYSKGKTPVSYAFYEKPANPKLPAQYLKTDVEIEDAYNKTMESFNYLAEDFFPNKSAGGKFISGRGLLDLFEKANGSAITIDVLKRANKYLLDNWQNYPPLYVDGGDEKYFTLAEIFYLLASAIQSSDIDSLKEIELVEVFGPLIIDPNTDKSTIEVDSDEIISQAQQFAIALKDGSGKKERIPTNVIPVMLGITVNNNKHLHPLLFLKAMAELFKSVIDNKTIPDTVTVSPTDFDPKYKTISKVIWSIKPAVMKN